MILQDLSLVKNRRRISQSEIRNSAAAKSEGGQKFLSPNPLPFCPPERSIWRAKRAVNSVQNKFGFGQIYFKAPYVLLNCVYLTKSEPILNGIDGALRAPNWTLGRAKRKGVGGKEFLPALAFRHRRISYFALRNAPPVLY